MKIKDLVSKDKMIVVMDNLATTIDAEESQRINNVEVREGLDEKSVEEALLRDAERLGLKEEVLKLFGILGIKSLVKAIVKETGGKK